MTNWQEQYKSALRSFNQEVKELKEKLEESAEKRSRSQGNGEERVGDSVGPSGDGQD